MHRGVAFWALALMIVVACGDDEDERRCEPGAVRSCLCPDMGTLAKQTCNEDGRTHTTCAVCPAIGTGGGGGNGGSGGTGG